MMSAASCRFAGSTSPFAVSWILVPPWRSSPRLGFQLPPMATRPNRMAVPTKKNRMVRPGWRDCLATSVAPLTVEDLDDRAAGGRDDDAVGQLELDLAVLDAADGAVEAGCEHDL